MKNQIYQQLCAARNQKKKSFAVLIDPDKIQQQSLEKLIALGKTAQVDYWFVGGSLVVSNHLEQLVVDLKTKSEIPVILFPGSPSQVTPRADALLYLSLISGRNPELLIGQHVLSAPAVKQSGLEILSTGYMVIDGGAPTTVSYISNATPIPSNKNEIALCTALAGEMLGMKLIYMDAGSGAQKPIPVEMIQTVAAQITVPLLVGGGITTPAKAAENCKAGADLIVVGNAIEKDPGLITAIGAAVKDSSSL
ncbi:MAG: geranylgeranylglyceryl/heptaprenylglyceryl phosphate synthase [Bacteroidetes bacterium]|nr:geranylgeranylglyceryl/heptaprenylglyceryl phosphate synthase [Bacteroidota bacterium]